MHHHRKDPPILLPHRRAATRQSPAIRPGAVAKFLAGTGPITRTWHFKYSALKGFFQFAVSRGHLDKVPLPTELPKCPPTLRPLHLLT